MKKIIKQKNMSKILLAEDDKFISRAYKDGLEDEGFEVEVIDTGTATLEKLRQNKPDMLLLDLIMPEKDGFEVLEEISQDENLSDLPIIVISNLGQESDINKAKKLGAKDYLVKSDHSMKDVISKVREAVSHKS